MRLDMKDLLVNEGRSSKDYESPRDRKFHERCLHGSLEDMEDLPDKSPMRYHTKMSTHRSPVDHLRPLFRFYFSRAGQHIDKVYSEIAAHMNMRSFRGQHLWEHANDVFEKHKVSYRFRQLAIPGAWWWGDEYVYVDEQRILRRGRRLKAPPRKKEDPTEIPIDQNTKYEKLAGIWYWIRTGTKKEARPWIHTGDQGEILKITWREFIVSKNAILEKRQLSKKDLKRLELKND